MTLYVCMCINVHIYIIYIYIKKESSSGPQFSENAEQQQICNLDGIGPRQYPIFVCIDPLKHGIWMVSTHVHQSPILVCIHPPT